MAIDKKFNKCLTSSVTKCRFNGVKVISWSFFTDDLIKLAIHDTAFLLLCVAQRLLPALTLSEKVTIYLGLASIQVELGNNQEATKVIQDTVSEFKGTKEEYR